MSLGAGTDWEVRTTGNAANSGGFDAAGSSPGTDYAQQDAPQVIIDGVTITATVHSTTTQLNIVGHTVSAADNRNLVRIAGGTMTAGTYEITAIDVPNNRWTMDRSCGTAAQTGTGRMGGAQSDPALVAALAVAQNRVYIKAGTYTITSASTNVAGGCLSSSAAPLYVEGYQTTRGDMGTAPLLQASGISTFTIFSSTGNDSYTRNLRVDGASLTASRGILARHVVERCVGLNCTNSAMVMSTACTFLRCQATGCSAVSAYLDGMHVYGIAYNNTFTGYRWTSQFGGAIGCIADSNSGATSDGFLADANGLLLDGNAAYNNGRDGIRINAGGFVGANNVAFDNAGTDINEAGSALTVLLMNNAAETLSNTARFAVNLNNVTLTTIPWTDAPNQDFTLNDDAGGGALCQLVGYPGELPIGGMGFRDIGPLQLPSAGAGGAVQLVNGGLVS